MDRPNSGTFPTHAGGTGLLHLSEHVSVNLVANNLDRVHNSRIQGTISGVDDYGLLIDEGNNTSVFIPWSSVRTVLIQPA